jgi:hypothetical protein
MQIRHLPNRDNCKSSVTILKFASTHGPRFLTGFLTMPEPPISERPLPFMSQR